MNLVVIACILVFISFDEKIVKAQDNNNDGGTRNTDPINSSDAEPNIPYRGLVDDYLRYAGVRNNFDKGYGYPEDNTGNRFFDDSRNFEGNSDNYRIPGRFGFHENTGGLRNPYEFYRNNGPYRDRFGNYGRYGDNREDMIGFRPDGGYRGRYENSLNSGNFRPFSGNYDDYRRYNPFRDYYDPYNRYDNNRFQPYQSPYQDIRSPYSGYGERYDPGYVGNRFFENENNADHGLENQEGNYNRVLENDTVGVNNRTSGDFSDSRGWGNDGFRPSNPDQSSNSGFRRWYPNFGNYDESSFPMPYAERREPFRNNERVPDDPSNINNNYGPNHGFYERAPSRKEENISQEQNSEENVSQEQNSQEQNSEENVSQEQNSEENK